ncbi:MAG TPA: hypothetical protein DEF82_11210 [Crocinitomicaceae bacterium]|nr:hypothetical protein [Flavobacteriales bacterium]HBW87275.1 hypothetical protein [Crocinitomicaceae bacterium]
MKPLFLILFILFLVSSEEIKAHPYFFAFAEVEYNELNQSLEATIIASAHDVESVLKENKIISTTLDEARKNNNEYFAINTFLNKHLCIHSADSLSISALDSALPPQLEFILEGFEVLLNGDVQFYLSTKIAKPTNQFYVKFDLIMDKFPDQQNKLTIRFRDKKNTYNFLNTTKTQFIKLEI